MREVALWVLALINVLGYFFERPLFVGDLLLPMVSFHNDMVASWSSHPWQVSPQGRAMNQAWDKEQATGGLGKGSETTAAQCLYSFLKQEQGGAFNGARNPSLL